MGGIEARESSNAPVWEDYSLIEPLKFLTSPSAPYPQYSTSLLPMCNVRTEGEALL